MTLTHLPTRANIISNQTFGFVSGAEGFIFLSGFMIGQLEHRIEQKGGRAATLRDLSKRTIRVYGYHLLLLLIAFTLVAEVGVRFHRLALKNLLSYYLQSPKEAATAAVLLLYRPSLLDILPMYVLFLALTPLARWVARRWGWDPIVYSSFAFWAAAQFGLRHWIYQHVNLFGLSVPETSTGAFDVYAWQLLWMVALALGSIFADTVAGQIPPPSAPQRTGFPKWLVPCSIALAVVFLFLRYAPVDTWIDHNVYGWLIDKWHLGPARVINFSALAIILVQYGQRLGSLRIFQPLSALGRASIEVFSVHVLCCLAGDSLSADADPHMPWWQQIILLAVTLSALFATAHLQQLWKADRKRQRPVLPVP